MLAIFFGANPKIKFSLKQNCSFKCNKQKEKKWQHKYLLALQLNI